MIDNLLEIKCMLASTKPEIIAAVKSALEDSAIQAGQVTYDRLKDLMDQSESRLIALVQKHSGNGSNGESQKQTQKLPYLGHGKMKTFLKQTYFHTRVNSLMFQRNSNFPRQR